MTYPRCENLLVHEYVPDHREGPLGIFRGSQCLNCDPVHDDVIRMNQRWPSLKQVRSCNPKSKIIGAFVPLTCSERAVPC